MSDCGCNKTSGEPSVETPDYMLVRATGKNASKCGDAASLAEAAADGLSSTVGCTKTDPTYDLLMADFAFPSDGTAVALVCNGAIYSVGQWIEFVNAGAKVQITSINDKQLTVRAICNNGAVIDSNPTAGTIIKKNDSIVAIDAPECLTDAQKLERITSALESAEQLCLPALVEGSGNNAKYQMVGWLAENPDDSGFKKCLKRMVSFFFKAGHPYLENLDLVDLASSSSYRPLVIHKTTHKIVEQKNLSEETALEAGKKYVYGVISGSQALVEGYVFAPIDGVELFNHGGDFDDPDNWTAIPSGTPLETSVNLNVSSVNAISILGDYFYAVLRINLGCWNPSAFPISAALRLDNVLIGYIHGFYNVKGSSTITIIKKVSKSSKSLPLKITTDGTGGNLRVHCDVKLDGIFH